MKCLPAVLVLLVCSPATAGAEPPAMVFPEADAILDTLKPTHPRLVLSNERIEQLRREIDRDETLARWHRDLTNRAESIIAATPSKYEIPDGKRLLSTSRRVLERVTTLALLYRLDGDERYVERAYRELEAAAKFKDWNPSHFLDTAELCRAFGVGYDWLYDQWTIEQRAVLRRALVEHGLKKGAIAYRGEAGWGWFHRSEHNWNQVCNGGLCVGALAIADEEPELAGQIVAAAVRSVPRAMQHHAPDGAWGEGVGYWHYATRYNVFMLASLESALGTDFGLSEIPGFSEAGSFPAAMSGPFGIGFNYADSGAGHVRAPQMFWLARKFDRPEFAAYQLHAAEPDALDLLWYDARGCDFSFDRLPRDTYFRETEVASFRSAWDDPDALFLAFKAGVNPVNHSNLDLGTFVLDALGKRWFVDLGADNYNLPGYFGSNRWTYYRLRAEAHNTLVINPSEAPDQDPKARTKIVSFSGGDVDSPQAVLDLTPAYLPHATSVRRTFTMTDRRSVTVRDEIAAESPADVWTFYHTPAAIDLADDGRAAMLSIDERRLRVELLSPAGAHLQILPAVPLPTSPNPSGQRSNGDVRKLAVHQEEVVETTIEVRLTPQW